MLVPASVATATVAGAEGSATGINLGVGCSVVATKQEL